MKKQLIIVISMILVAVFLAAFMPSDEKPVIYLIGDSTCADKPLDDNPERGWGQLFPNFFQQGITIENHAKNGRSTKSFRNEGLWNKVFEKLKPGDYVFIQFGHNDSKINDTTRYAEPHTAYKQNLIRYVEESRSKGAIPVLLTPVNRRKFDEQGKFVDQHGDYPVVVREVAKELNVALIDVHKKSLDYFSKLGEEATKNLFIMSVPKNVFKSLPNGRDDNTHFTRTGAIEVAKMVVEGIKEINLPVEKYLLNEVKISSEAEGKVVALDYYFNHEFKKDKDGKDVPFHYIWEDKEFSGYYEIGNMIENLGAGLYEIPKAPKYDELKKVSVYIIVDPDTPKETANPNYMTDSSAAEIAKWVEDGGVLVLLANDTGNCELENFNKLSDKFGIHFNEDSRNKVTGTNFSMGKFDKFPDHPLFKGVGAIYLKEISTLKLSSPAEPLFTDGADVLMATAKFGKGFVFALGDPWIYNEYYDNRKLPAEFENYKAAKNLFSWLLSKAKKVR